MKPNGLVYESDWISSRVFRRQFEPNRIEVNVPHTTPIKERSPVKTYIHLTQFDRTLIAYLLQQNMSLSQIAYQLKRSKSTVSSEIRRNSNNTNCRK
jgi:DNA-binding NarL/FixJ family response regulator